LAGYSRSAGPEGEKMKITHKEFRNLLIGARTLDDLNWPRLKISEWLLERYAFDDKSVRYIVPGDPPPWQWFKEELFSMSTIYSRQIVNDIITRKYEDDGWMKIVEYTNQFGERIWGCVAEGDHDPNRYERETESIRDPKVIWERR
jgi:hypothetical protein